MYILKTFIYYINSYEKKQYSLNDKIIFIIIFIPPKKQKPQGVEKPLWLLYFYIN